MEDEGCKPEKNIGGGETPVKKTSQQLSAESTTEHPRSATLSGFVFPARTRYGGCTPACGLIRLSAFHHANCHIISIINWCPGKILPLRLLHPYPSAFPTLSQYVGLTEVSMRLQMLHVGTANATARKSRRYSKEIPTLHVAFSDTLRGIAWRCCRCGLGCGGEGESVLARLRA